MVQATERVDAAVETAPRPVTGGQALIDALYNQGIHTIFALPGIQLDPAFDALYKMSDQIRVVHTRHEQGAAYMADGFARATGEPGVCLVVPGPGLLNATAALSTAYACNSPVLCVTGQIQSDLIEFGRGVLHEIPNQLGMVRSVTKWAGRAVTPEAIPGLVEDAFTHMFDGRQRPVEIEVPPDTLYKVAEVTGRPPVTPPAASAGDPDLLAKAVTLLTGAKKPLIWSGGGVIGGNASDALRRLAEALEAPVVMTANGKGALSSRHYLAQNFIGGMSLVAEADVILAVGTRFVEPATSAWGIKPDHQVIQLDIDPGEIGRNAAVAIGIEADAKAGLNALADLVLESGHKPASREAELRALQEESLARAVAVGIQAEYAMAIRRAVPDDGIIVSEMTQVGYWSNMALPVYEPRTFLTCGYQGTLGFGFPTALGVKVGMPDKVVVSINGDGGFGFCLNELSTMARHNIPAIVLVFNDDAFGNVQRIQREQFGGRTIASDLLNPDFVALAEAFGVKGARVENPAALEQAIRDGIEAGAPLLIEIPIPAVPNPWTVLGIR